MLKDYFKLAYKSARQRKLRSWLTMIGIFIGIAAVVALISLSQGLQTAVEQQFVQLGSDKLVVQAAGFGFGPPGTGVADPLTEDDEDEIKKVKGVEQVVGRLIRTAKVKYKDEIKYPHVVSMPDGGDSQEMDLVVEANNYKIEKGRMLKKGDKYKIVVGSEFVEDYYDRPFELKDRVTIQGQDFRVVGILKKSGNPQQDLSMLVPESALREILDLDDELDIILLKVKSEEDVPFVEERVKKALRKSRDLEEGKEDFTVETPGQIIATLTSIIAVIQGVLVGIASISLVVGGIGIMNTMYTAVVERTKEIGIMKALGARRRRILLLFMIESGFLGLFGGAIGVVLGMSISKMIELVAAQIYGTNLIQADFNLFVIFGALMFAFTIGGLSGVFPARQAAILKPVDALRQ